jgi:hypothetical protein
MHATTNFPHRHNSDGSYDSICKTCYATVASAQNEEALSSPELVHVCDSFALYRANQGFPVRTPISWSVGAAAPEPTNPGQPTTRDSPYRQTAVDGQRGSSRFRTARFRAVA